MKKNIGIKCCCLALIALIGCFFGCSNPTERPEHVQEPMVEKMHGEVEGVNEELSKYNLRFVDGKQYLQLKNPQATAVPLSNEFQGISAIPRIEFLSLEEFISKIYSGNFTEKEMKELARFQTGENGIEIFNLNNPFKLVFPDGYEIDYFAWEESRFVYGLKDGIGGKIKVCVMPKECYDNYYDAYIGGAFDSLEGFQIISEEKIDNTETIVYATSSSRLRMERTYVDGGVIQKKYLLSTVAPLAEENNIVPGQVIFFKDYGDCGMVIPQTALKEDYPTDFYLQFGLVWN